MVPKRRKSVETVDATSTKRVTRSSTRASGCPKRSQVDTSDHVSAPSKHGTVARPPRRGSKPSKAGSTATLKSKGSKFARKEEDRDKHTSVKKDIDTTTLSISSDLLKNPLQCVRYERSIQSPRSSDNDNHPLIFTHGAGGTLAAPAVVNFCTGFSATHSILAFQGNANLASRAKGFDACIEHLEGKGDPPSTLLLGGRSMGARAATIAAYAHLHGDPALQGRYTSAKLILINYPLVGPKGNRDAGLISLPASALVLFIAGENDAMCPLDMLHSVCEKMEAESTVVVVRGADHGMRIKGKGKDGEREVGESVGRLAARWVRGEEVEGEIG